MPDPEIVWVSEPCATFIKTNDALVTFTSDVLLASAKLDGFSIPVPEGQKSAEEAVPAAMAGGGKYLRLLTEMILCRGVDNYLTYISELLALIYHTCPEAMKSNETVTYETILNYFGL